MMHCLFVSVLLRSATFLGKYIQGHFVAIVTTRSKESSKFRFRKRKASFLFTIPYHIIKFVDTHIRNISHVSCHSSKRVHVGHIKLISSCEIVHPGPPFSTIVPDDQWCIRFEEVLTDCFLQYANIIFSNIRSLCTLLQPPHI